MSATVADARRSNPQDPSSPGPSAVLGLRHGVAIIVGVVLGAGIFKAPSLVAGMAGSTGWMFAAWVLGGMVSLIGALCYAELATTYPHAGGEYHFLHRAFGRRLAFLYAWARFSVITTGSIALLAFVFGDYMQQVLPLGRWGVSIYAAASVLLLGAVNLRGMRAGASTQGWLTLLEVGGLMLIVLAGLYLLLGGADTSTGGDAALAAASAPDAAPAWSAFGMAMVFVLLTFGGWNEAAYLSAEMKDEPDGKGGLRRGRTMVRVLVLSISIITVLYLLVNWAYWLGLGRAGMAASDAIAADLLKAAFGSHGATLIAVVVAIAALTSINATMIVGARTGYAVGCDWPSLGRLGHWDPKSGGPQAAMLLQSTAALLLVGLGALADDGFRAMVEFTAPVFWLFFLLTGVSLLVLRRREPQRDRPYEVPLYPLLPLVFVAVCGAMLWSSLSYVANQAIGGFNAAWVGICVLLAGALLSALLSARPQLQRSAP
jgi:APA family basic amino acid/polyamine antiporter